MLLKAHRGTMKVLVTAISLLLLANSPALSADIDGVLCDTLPKLSFPAPYFSPAENSSQTSGIDAFGSGQSALFANTTKMNTAQAPTLAPESPELKAAWQQWHGRVAHEIRGRFVSMTNTAFNNARAENSATVSYTVTRFGRITQVHLIHKSPNPVFNAIVIMAITSVSTNLILKFPVGSTQTEVEKTASFSINSKASSNSSKERF
jgi:TonB C terminal